MEVLDLFSAAAGGWSLGMHRAGFTTIAACEVEPWRRALYSQNNPSVEMYDDVRTLTAERLRADLGRLPSIVVGSPPCQDISSANTKGKGVEGERSGLYFEAIRIIGEVRPRWFALENSANLRTRGADAVLAALEALGYACWPVVVRAGDIGANHERPRCWIIGCDLEQVADPNGVGRDEGWRGRQGGVDASVPVDPLNAARVGYEGGRARRYGAYGHGEASIAGGDVGDATQDGCGSRVSGRRAEPVERVCVEACGNAAHAHGNAIRLAVLPRGPQSQAPVSGDAYQAADANTAGERPQGQSGCNVERQGKESERPDVPAGREVGVCAPDRGDAVGGGPLWSLADLADHLRVDDGLSARLAGTRVDLGDGKRQSAASLIVEAYGDAVVPQIPEAIGRAILRVEAAMAAVI